MQVSHLGGKNKFLWVSSSIQDCFNYRKRMLEDTSNSFSFRLDPLELEVWSGEYSNPTEWVLGITQIESSSSFAFGVGIYGVD